MQCLLGLSASNDESEATNGIPDLSITVGRGDPRGPKYPVVEVSGGKHRALMVCGTRTPK